MLDGADETEGRKGRRMVLAERARVCGPRWRALYSSPEPVPMCIGMMLEDDTAINQCTFTPQKGDFYHYLVLNREAEQIEARHAIYQGNKMDEQNARMHNCFKTMLDAVKYKALIRRALEK